VIAVRRCLALALMAAGLGLGVYGCGPGAGAPSANVTVTVTRDFGSRPLARIAAARVPGGQTVMSLLERHLRVGTRYGNDFVESIDGYSGTASERDWFYYVDGIEASAGAGTTAVRAGERIWWDLHDWAAAESIPAVIGSYPDPFTQGAAPHRTILSCAADTRAACAVVARALARAGVSVERRALDGARADATGGPAVVVGTGHDLAAVPAERLIAAGPRASGVYVRFLAGYRTLELLDPRGAVRMKLGSGAGLVAATAVGGSGPATWLITGTDPAGVAAAAGALTPGRLRDAFALAVTAAGRPLPVPLDPSS
jgi:hypothetical protein